MTLSILSCAGGGSAPFNETNNPIAIPPAEKYLYVASGACYAGGATVSAGPSNTITKFNLETGAQDSVVIDYNQLAPGDQPVALADFDSETLMVLVQNTGGRRIDLVKKDGTGFTTYLANATALTGTMRDIELLADYSVLVSKSTAIEKFNAGKSRVTSGANPYVNAPAAPCAVATTMITSMVAASSGLIVYTHAAASPNNEIGVISATGYAAAADCKSATAPPVATALPTRALFHNSGKLLISFGSSTTNSNFIYSYDFDISTGALSNATAVFNDPSVLNGPSSMAQDTDTGDIYVAVAQSNFNTIEKFTFANNTLTREAGPAFIPYSVYTRCVADLMVGY